MKKVHGKKYKREVESSNVQQVHVKRASIVISNFVQQIKLILCCILEKATFD